MSVPYKIGLIALCLLLSSCNTYSPSALAPQKTLAEVEKSRRLLDNSTLVADEETNSSEKVSFAKAAALLAANNPALDEARAEYKKAYALAQVKTPLPNPEVEGGVLIGSRLGDDDSGRVQPAVAFGFTIPLSSRLSREDELNTLLAHLAYLQLLLEHRSKYLALRRFYLRWVLLHGLVAARKNIYDSAQRSLEISKRLVEAGTATALDVGIMELEAFEKQKEWLESRTRLAQIRSRLSQLVGIRADFAATELPPLPQKTPGLKGLKESLVANHPSLAVLRAGYQIAEKELHLEIEKEIPDVTISPSFEGDPGDDKKIWGVALKFPLPIFDRNQRAVTDKRENRELIRVRYRAALKRALAALEWGHEEYLAAKEKLSLMRTRILPAARENLALALESVKRGEVDFLKYLESERALRRVIVAEKEAQIEMYRAWTGLEQTVGVPLFEFADESSEPPLLPGLEQPTTEQTPPLPRPNDRGEKQ